MNLGARDGQVVGRAMEELGKQEIARKRVPGDGGSRIVR